MMGEVTGGLKALYNIHAWLASRNTKKLEEARDELFRDWTVELELALKQAAELAEKQHVKLDTLEARVAEPAYKRAVEIIEAEAANEPGEERRRMLAYAAASWPVLALTVTQLSRTLRILLEIEPDDARILETLSALGDQVVPKDVYSSSEDGARRHERLGQYPESEAILLATGCLRTRYATGLNNLGAEIHVTPIGTLVLSALRVYLLACENDTQFATRPLAELARTLPDGHPDRNRLLKYQSVVEVATALKEDLDASGDEKSH